MNQVDTNVQHLFKCVEAAHLICLEEFLEMFKDDSYSRKQICELWLRFLLNGGKTKVHNITEALLTASSESVSKLFRRVKLSPF